MKVSELIRAGMAEIETHGWCQNLLRNEQGQLCLEGSLVSALNGQFLNPKEYDLGQYDTERFIERHSLMMEARTALSQRVLLDGLAYGSAVSFNDKDGTSQEDVLLLMKTVAEELESEGK